MKSKHPSWFSTFSKNIARYTGRPVAFGLACAVVLAWVVTGPLFGYSDTWQLVINTGTTIVTFLMVFLIQNSQNRDTEAVHVKLDELIRAMTGAHNAVLDLENLEEDELDKIRARYTALAKEARESLKHTKRKAEDVEREVEDTKREVKKEKREQNARAKKS